MNPGIILPLLLVSMAAGFLGALLGLGGGIIIVPAVTLLFGRNIHEAIGASIVSVIATSTSAAAVYLRHGYVNIRLALNLELATVIGATAGGLIGVALSRRPLEALFAALMLYAAYSMIRNRGREAETSASQASESEERSDTVQFLDRATGETQSYRPKSFPIGAGMSVLAGLQSGMLGVGGGVIKVPVMNLIMGIPLKAAIATSNYMIGITAATSAMIYYVHGYVKPMIAGPCVIGVFLGAQIGSRVGSRTHSAALRWVFVALLVFISGQMFHKAFGAG